MPTYTWTGLSEKERLCRTAAAEKDARPITLIDGGLPLQAQQQQQKAQEREVAKVVKEALASIDDLDAELAIGDLKFPKGEAVTVESTHELCKPRVDGSGKKGMSKLDALAALEGGLVKGEPPKKPPKK